MSSIGYSSVFETPDYAYPDDALCDRCLHRNDEHASELLGCLYNAATKESGGVDYSCSCGGFVPPFIDDSNLPRDRAEWEQP